MPTSAAAPDSTKRGHVVGRAVSAWGRTVDTAGARRERRAEVGQPVRAQPGHAQSHEDERVEPASPQHALAAHPLDEGAVEAAVVRHDVALAHELGELSDGRLRARSARDHGVVDAGELGDLERDRYERVHERRECGQHLGPAHDRRGYLDDAVALGVVAGGLDVEDRDLVLEAVRHVARTLCKRLVGVDHVGVGPGHDELF